MDKFHNWLKEKYGIGFYEKLNKKYFFDDFVQPAVYFDDIMIVGYMYEYILRNKGFNSDSHFMLRWKLADATFKKGKYKELSEIIKGLV